MNRNVGVRRTLLAGVALAGMGGPALAQEVDGAGGVADIVVTATRQSASLQAIPIAVTALSGDTLAAASITSLKDVAQLAPGLQILPAFTPGNPIFQIRGQVQTDTAPTIDPSVGVYFDDVYIARSAGSLANFLDVARVEVLKGPQGTLFGKNTTGGAIRIISNRPNDRFEGYAKIGYQSYDKATIEGVLNIPITNGVNFRAAGQYIHKTGGYYKNIITGNPIDTDKTFFGRASLLLEPTDNLEILLQGDYTNVDAGGLPNRLKDFVLANGASVALSVAAQNGKPGNIAAGTAIILNQITQTGGRNLYADVRIVTADGLSYTPGTPPTVGYTGGSTDPFNRFKAYGGAANISLDMDFATLRSITAYREVRYTSSYNTDGAGGNVYITRSRGNVNSDQFSQELLLNGNAFDDRLDWTVGGIYFNENALQNDKSAPLFYLSAPGGSPGNITIADSKNKSWGVFAQGKFAVTDALSVTAGARRSHDKRSFVAQAYSLRLTSPQVCSYTVANGLATLPIFSSPCSLSQSASFNQWSYTASVDYQLGQGQLLYVRTGRGYRAGGFNARVALPQVLGSFDPEIVTDYEVGLKADWLNRTLRTNIALFTSKSRDTQQTVNGVSGVTSFTRTSNVGTRKVRGVEGEITAVPSKNLSFDANFAYTTGKLVNPFTPDVSWLPETPKWTFGYGATLQGDLSDAVHATLRADLSYRDKMKSINVLRGAAPVGSPAGTLGPVVYVPKYKDRILINARATLAHSRTGIELAVFGTNLLNERYAARIIGINGLGIGMETLGEPRVLGVELKVPFGAMK